MKEGIASSMKGGWKPTFFWLKLTSILKGMKAGLIILRISAVLQAGVKTEKYIISAMVKEV